MFLMFCQLIAATASAQVSYEAPFVLGPPNSNEPIPVHVGFFLSDVTDVDEEREMFQFEAVLTVSWLDERQAFDPEVLGAKERVYQEDNFDRRCRWIFPASYFGLNIISGIYFLLFK